MIGVYTVAAVREAEQRVMATLAPGTLMQRAAYGLAGIIAEQLKDTTGHISGTTVAALIGPGNNGSDTLLALSYLARRGVRVIAVDVTGQRRPDHTDDAFNVVHGQWRSLDTLLNRNNDVDILLDGIAGIGSSRPVSTELYEFTQSFALNKPVIAVDVPSGIDADRAVPFDDEGYVHATLTVTFGCLKPCHVLDPAADLCGDVRLVGIGLEQLASFNTEPTMFLVDDDIVPAMFLGPTQFDNKYSRGVVGVIAGAHYPGAGLLAVRAARWGGAGMVRQVGATFTEDLATVVHHDTWSPDLKADAWVVGPGLGEKPASAALSQLLDTDKTLVIDADGLNALAHREDLRAVLAKRDALAVLTPHGGEAARLAHGYGVDLTDQPADLARNLAAASNAVVYLKGSVGVVATPEGRTYVTHRTTEHLSTAGSGDVLAGLLGSLLAANEPLDNTDLAHRVAAAIIVHSRAAELIALEGGPVIASEIEENLPMAIADLTSAP